MLSARNATLRPVRESDLAYLYDKHIDIDNRGSYFPRSIQSEISFRHAFAENGMWSPNEGTLIVFANDGHPVGHIEFFKTVNYLDEFELSYQIYDPEDRRRGYATDAVTLLVRYLFESKRVNRIRLVIHPDNAGSRNLATKCGFQHEGTSRGAWYHAGRHHDVEIYSILHDDVIT